MKISARIKDSRLNVRVRLSFSEQLSASEIELLQKRVVIGLLKPKQLRKRLVEYTGPAGISLSERLKKPMTKSDFLLIMAQIIDITRKMRSNNLFAKNICLDMKYVFIVEATGELMFLYLPVSSDRFTGADFLGFMSALVYEAKPFEGENSDYIQKFAFMLRSLDSFDPGKIDAYIAKEDRSVMAKLRRGPLDSSGFITDKPREYLEHYDNDDLDMTTGKLGESTSLFDESDFDSATGLLNDSDGFTLADEADANDIFSTIDIDEPSGDTELLCAQIEETSAKGDPARPRHETRANLVRVLDGEKILLDKPVFRVGKERSYVDYFVSNNNAVSRSHADLITRGTRYYIRDLNSKNRTFINGAPIEPEIETELADGDRVRLANEEFVFHVC